MTPDNKELIEVTTPKEWEQWLSKHYDEQKGIWIRFYKKATGKQNLSYAQALDVALCYGWIDGMSKSFDEESWIQKFTPRRTKSLWSKRNREHVARLINEGKMQAPGVAEIDRAKQDGRWDAAYDAPSEATIPEHFLKELNKNKKAKAYFESLNKANIYAIVWRLQTAKKPETREKRMRDILAMLESEKKLH